MVYPASLKAKLTTGLRLKQIIKMENKVLAYMQHSQSKYDPQENAPKFNQIVKGKIYHRPEGVYVKIKGFERKLNGVKQIFPICRFREVSFGELTAFKLSNHAAKKYIVTAITRLFSSRLQIR